MFKKRLQKEDILTIPNALSFFRLLLVPLIVTVYRRYENYTLAVVLIALSGLTDTADGYIARRFDMVSDFGKVLDPVADKLTQAAMIYCLASRYPLMWWLIGLFAAKEVLQAALGFITLKKQDVINSAKWFGKLSTGTLYAVMLTLILFPRLPEAAVEALIALCAAVLLLSLILYSCFYGKLLLGERFRPLLRQVARWLMIALEAGIIVFFLFHLNDITLESIVNYVPAKPWLAALVILALFALKSLSVVLYAGILFAAVGILFPLPAAIVINCLGVGIMSCVSYWLGRGAGADYVDQLRTKYPKLHTLETLHTGNDFFFSLLVRLLKILPYDAVSAYMGAVRLRFAPYLLGSVLGMLPTCVTFPIMGTNIDRPGSPEFLIALGVQIGFTAASILSFTFYQRRKKSAESGA